MKATAIDIGQLFFGGTLVLRQRKLPDLISRLVLGTVLFLIIIVVGAALPVAAGVSLTFPLMNGLAFLTAKAGEEENMATTMILMPIVNGILCTLYLLLFLALRNTVDTSSLSIGLGVLVGCLWVGWMKFVETRKIGIAPSAQLRYAIVSTAVFLGLAMAATFWVGDIANPASRLYRYDLPFIFTVIDSSRLKLVLFILAWGGFLVYTSFVLVSAKRKGVFGGLPLVPFGGLMATTWSYGETISLTHLHGLASSVWASPIVPIWFIFFFSRFSAATTLAPWRLKFAVLVGGWVLCGVAVYGLTMLLTFVVT